MSNYETPVLTNRGFEILTEKNAGNAVGEPLKITKMAIGTGMLPLAQKPEELTDLICKLKAINIIDFEITGLGLSDVTGEINNIGITEETPIFEIGVYVQDPMTMEDTLYTYTYTRSTPTILYPPVTTLYVGDHTVKTIITRDAEPVVNVVKPERAKNISYDESKTKLSARNVQGAIDALACSHVIEIPILHGLDCHPKVVAIETAYGFGMKGFGSSGFGGESEHQEIKCRGIYLNRNSMKVAMEKKYEGTPTLQRISDGEFVFRFPNIALIVSLISDYATMNRAIQGISALLATGQWIEHRD